MIAICCAQYEIAEHVSKNRCIGLFFSYCEVDSQLYVRSSPIFSNRTHLSFHLRLSLSLSLSLSFSFFLLLIAGQAGRGQGESPRAAGGLLEGAADGERERTIYIISS